jgi:plasmid stabilization system protein ParE
MVRQIIWSESAAEDLEAIADRIAQDSPSNAKKVVKKILAAADDLDRFPQLGTVVSEANDADLRQRIVFHYRLVYRVEANSISILAVIHARRRLRNR